MTFGNLLILPVVVKVPGTAGILNTFFCCKTMTHLMQKSTARFLYWAAKRGAADVDFIPPLVSCLPNLAARMEQRISGFGGRSRISDLV